VSEARRTIPPGKRNAAQGGGGLSDGVVDDWDLLARFGVKVLEVDDLPDPVCFVPTQGVGLVRAGLSPDRRMAIGAKLLAIALSYPGPGHLGR